MLNTIEISAWLVTRFRYSLVLEAWIFGSVINDKKIPNDVDLFIKYKNGMATEASNVKGRLEADFQNSFNYRLHVLMLSEQESIEFSHFLAAALKQGCRIL